MHFTASPLRSVAAWRMNMLPRSKTVWVGIAAFGIGLIGSISSAGWAGGVRYCVFLAVGMAAIELIVRIDTEGD